MGTGNAADITGVNTPTLQATPDVVTKLVIPDFGDQCHLVTKPRCRHRNIGGASPHRFVEALLMLKTCVRLPCIEVDADASNTDDVRDHDDSRVGATFSTRYSIEVVTW